jgi:hypothetical protein
MIALLGVLSLLVCFASLLLTIYPKWIKVRGESLTRKSTLKIAGISFAIMIGLMIADGSSDEQASSTNTEDQNTVSSENTSSEKEKVKDDKESRQKEEEEKQKEEEERQKKLEEEKQKLEEQLTFDGNMDLKVDSNKKVVATITSNVPDGGLFEVTIMDGKFNVLSEFIPIENGKIVKEFEIPEEWGIGYITGIAMFRFNLDDKPQPEHIKELYGDNGDKMKGSLIVKNHLGGNNGNVEGQTIAYPNEKAVEKEKIKLFNQALQEMIDVSNGVVIDIGTRYNDNDWKLVNVVVSDSWYYSQDYEKERFAKTVGGTVEQLVLNAGLAEGTVMVYFVDSYGKDVASPKVFGGYDIEG